MRVVADRRTANKLAKCMVEPLPLPGAPALCLADSGSHGRQTQISQPASRFTPGQNLAGCGWLETLSLLQRGGDLVVGAAEGTACFDAPHYLICRQRSAGQS